MLDKIRQADDEREKTKGGDQGGDERPKFNSEIVSLRLEMFAKSEIADREPAAAVLL